MIVRSVPSLLSPPVVVELQQANLITSVECKWLQLVQYYCGSCDLSDVVRIQRGKSPQVMSKAAGVMRRHEFKTESKFLAGRQSRPSSIRPSFISLCYVVQWSLLMMATL